ILSTRKAYSPGLFGQPGRPFVEVVARIPGGGDAHPERPSFDQDMAAHDLVRAIAEATAAAPLPDAARPTGAAERAFAGTQRVAAPADLPEVVSQPRRQMTPTEGPSAAAP